jgi:MFS transporter, PAT family, beta-lactamase induction signal transducer AmpG
MNKLTPSRNPWSFVPTLYFAEGLPYIIINVVSVVLYKRMGIDNTQIAFWTSWLYLPWVIKMFWSPFVDLYSTKRNWVLFMQLAMAAALVLAAFSLRAEAFFFLSLACFTAGAFVSATQDIAIDGFYMLALTKEDQAYFVGIRASFYRAAMIFGSGFLVYLAGVLEVRTENIPLSWSLVLALSGLLFVFLLFYHRMLLPFPAADGSGATQERPTASAYGEVFRTYFRQQGVWAIVTFILLYRLGEAMLVKLVPPFLLDPTTKGGLGLTTQQVGLAYGTIGIVSLVVGGILGGWLVSKYGLKRWIWPMALALNLPDLFYVYMAHAQPGMNLVYPLVALEQFGYGLGFTAFMVYLMYAAKGEYKTSHFAISTGIMALGMMLPGMVSGWLQEALGYKMFFIMVCFLTIPGMLTLLFIPDEEKNE